MDSQDLSAPRRATAVNRPTAPRSGVIHVNMRHTSRYTVIGNHLAQHRQLSLTAIGLATHIQSLPTGTSVGIKALAERFPEGEIRIAAALRELEAHGYLERTRERLPNGQVVARTVSYNKPGARPGPDRAPDPTPDPAPERDPDPAPEPPRDPDPTADPTPDPTPEPPQRPEPGPGPVPPPPPLPEPTTTDPARQRAAAGVLIGLRAHDPRLLLSERDVHRLAPAVAAWLERGAAPDAVRRTLAACLPEPLRHPTALLAHRLTALLPPPLLAALPAPDPLQTCEDCDRAFRAPEPGHCRDCRPSIEERAA
ncbi:DNA-binding protein [Streptomyces purpureus]|uniref:DNA-binding protein n=1 Tax=Streptomyces purpureus TaxID=1951 RepID=A0A918H3E2_9ACTN|nr:DNA-binding protein [Streptomyces purpureus]GGT34513.1 hypothetical protein GCM10014713_30140 [Streptomyces purpureus]